jgi:vacuolar-type H+-ATPase subunit E/Vma4
VTGDTPLDAEAAALVAEIDREAEAEKQRILGEAGDRAARIHADADARIRAAAQEASQLTEKLARVDEDRLQGQTRMEAQAERLTGLHRAYQLAIQTARERIDSLVRSPRYPDAMKTLIAEALEIVRDAAVVSVARADQQMCRDILAELGKGCQVAGQDLAPGSVIVSSADGRIRADNSLGVRLASAEVILETQIARTLNG